MERKGGSEWAPSEGSRSLTTVVSGIEYDGRSQEAVLRLRAEGASTGECGGSAVWSTATPRVRYRDPRRNWPRLRRVAVGRARGAAMYGAPWGCGRGPAAVPPRLFVAELEACVGVSGNGAPRRRQERGERGSDCRREARGSVLRAPGAAAGANPRSATTFKTAARSWRRSLGRLFMARTRSSIRLGTSGNWST